jgi:hypothetical protein
MKRVSVFTGALLTVLFIAIPALAAEDGIIDTSSTTPNADFTHADFERVITNATEGPIDIAPRDLRMAEYPIMTVTSVTVGTFDAGFWTIGTLEAGQTATIVYTGDAPEELPFTGQRDDLAAFAFTGLALIGLGAFTLRVTRN